MDIFYILLMVLLSVHGGTYWSADTYWNDRYALEYTQSKYPAESLVIGIKSVLTMSTGTPTQDH
jgi:photosystem II stability/assembly factor-like uncharacterized protein